MLAYVFWHRPAGGADPEAYEARLAAFHVALAADPPDGFTASAALRVREAPWLPGSGPAYEDWYAVAGWDALGRLNDAAVRGPRARPHDEVAAEAVEMTAYEDFVTEEVRKGRSILGLYPATDEQSLADFAAWRTRNGR